MRWQEDRIRHVQVSGDTGEATCRGALEAAGLVGTNKGQISPQRLLFCSTLEGKASIVRQLEPQLHIDAHSKTVRSLSILIIRSSIMQY